MKKQVGLVEGFGLGVNLVGAAELEAMVKRGLFHGHFWGGNTALGSPLWLARTIGP